MLKFEALNVLLKRLFEKTASVATIYNTPIWLPGVSVQEILYSRCILGHRFVVFRVSEGLPNKRECVR